MAHWSETSELATLPDTSMQQHPAYGRACRSWLRPTLSLHLGDPVAPLATAQILRRHWPGLGRVALLSRGPVWRPGALSGSAREDAFRDLLKRLRVAHRAVIVTAERDGMRDPMAEQGFLQTMTPLHLAEVGLCGGPEAMRARLHGKWRNRLVRAESAGLKVVTAPLRPQPGHWLLQKEEEQAKAKRYRRQPLGFTVAWARANPRTAWELSAWEGPRVVAAVVILLHQPTASYHIAWSSRRGRDLCAANLLLWKAMLLAREQGATRLDLDTVDTEDSAGLARFKLGTGATIRQLGASWISAPGTGLALQMTEGIRRLYRRQMPSGQKA